MYSIASSFSRGRPVARRRLALLLLLSLLPSRPARAELTGSWVGDFSIPAFDGPVKACAIVHGYYVVGGDFRWAGSEPAANVAVWTTDLGVSPGGNAWRQVGPGLPSPVRELVLWNGELLAATENHLSGTSPVMRFDGTAWQPLGPGIYGEVEAILADGADLYIAGGLLKVGDAWAYRVMRWDGAEWQGVGGSFDSRVLSLGMYQGELYAGGDFLNAGNTFVSRIARWDGFQWNAVGGGTAAGGTESVAALAEYGGRLIAGGAFESMGGVEGTRGIAAWDGNIWAALPNRPQDTWVRDLQVEGPVLHVAGVLQVPGEWAAGVATFNGQLWQPPSLHPDWGIDDIAIGDGALIAVGQHTSLIQRDPYNLFPNRDVVVRDPLWHGLTPWRATMRGLMGPGHTDVSALINYNGELYAGGYFQYAAVPPLWTDRTGLARWDGAVWQAVGGSHGWVQEMTRWGHRLVIGGSGLSGDGPYSSVLAWDGSSWSDIGHSIVGWVGGLAEWQGDLVACGSLCPAGSTNVVSVVVNRGTRWERLGNPIMRDGGLPMDVASFGGNLYLAASVAIPGSGYKGVVRWDGSNWVEIPDTPVESAECLLVRQDGLWVAGSTRTRTLGGAIWKWDGVSWTAIEGLVGSVYDLVEMDGVVFASGALHLPEGPTGLAQWDGTAWHAVPGAPRNGARSLGVVGRDLWLGGWFTNAGGRQAEGIARWRVDAPAPIVPLSMAQPWPTPARERVSFRFSLPADGRVELRIYDVRGSLVAKPVDEWLPGGTYERTWSIAAARERIHAGVYFARLVTPTETRNARIVIGASAPIRSARSQP